MTPGAKTPVVVADGESLSIDDVVAVARDHAPVRLDDCAPDRIRRGRLVVERAIDRGDEIYGVTTGAGAHKRFRVQPGQSSQFEALMLASQGTGHGPPMQPDLARAALLRLVNGFAKGVSGVRVELVDRLLEALNTAAPLEARTLGSIGIADLIPLGELAGNALRDMPLAAKESMALIDNNSFSTAQAALAVHDCWRLLHAADTAGALSLEAFRGNLSILHPAIAAVRPRPSLAVELEHFRELLAGSELWDPGAARNLQDPLSFRTMVELHAALREALDYVERQVVIELNASQENPIVVADEDRLVCVANFECAAMAAALDLGRIALAPALTSSCERTAKLLNSAFSGLTSGLSNDPDAPDEALSGLAVASASLTSEARLLAQPVSFDVATSGIAEGIEDRATMAPLAARRLQEMISLGEHIVATELVVAAQAIDLRRPERLGAGTQHAYDQVRSCVDFTDAGEPPPGNLEPLVHLIHAGQFSILDGVVSAPTP